MRNEIKKRTIYIVLTIVLLTGMITPLIFARKTVSYTDFEGHFQYIPTIISDPVAIENNVYFQTTEQACWYDDIDYGEGNLIGYSDNGPCSVIIFGASEFPPTSGFDFRWYTAKATFEFLAIGGKTGVCEMRLVGRDYWQDDGSLEWEGNWVITASSGDLEGIQGYGTWSGPGWSPNYMPGYIPFEGRIYFPS